MGTRTKFPTKRNVLLAYSSFLSHLFYANLEIYVIYFDFSNLKSMAAYVVLIYLFFILYVCDTSSAISGAFYADNGREQTVLYKTLAKKDKIELQEEILNLLGLDHRPKKGIFSKRQKLENHKSSAEKYLFDLYKTLEEVENENNKSHAGLLTDSDFIVSFSNKSNVQFNN